MANANTLVTLPEFNTMRGDLLKVSATPTFANDFYPLLQEQAGETMTVQRVIETFQYAVLEFAGITHKLGAAVEVQQNTVAYLRVLITDPDAYNAALDFLAEQ